MCRPIPNTPRTMECQGVKIRAQQCNFKALRALSAKPGIFATLNLGEGADANDSPLEPTFRSASVLLPISFGIHWAGFAHCNSRSGSRLERRQRKKGSPASRRGERGRAERTVIFHFPGGAKWARCSALLVPPPPRRLVMAHFTTWGDKGK